MMFRLLKPLLPRSLFGRTLLIIISPLILLQIVSALVFFDSHWYRISWRLSISLAGEINSLIEDWNNPVLDQTAVRLRGLKDFGLKEFSFVPNDVLPNQAHQISSSVGETLGRALSTASDYPYAIDDRNFRDEVRLAFQLPDGVIYIVVPGNRLFSSTNYIFLLWMIGSSLVFFSIAAIFMRNQIRPLLRLTEAVDRFGKGEDMPMVNPSPSPNPELNKESILESENEDYRPSGASEIKLAAIAYNRMSKRVRRQVKQRTAMLSGVSHDLRTPLARLRLEAELVADEAIKASIRQNVQEMAAMIDSYLTFARGEAPEDPQMIDLTGLVEEMRLLWQTKKFTLDCHCEGDLYIRARPLALRRCLENIIGNARKFAHYARLHIAWRLDQGEAKAPMIEILLDDNGPGIPANLREQAFQPFVRLDGEGRSHNSDGGSGTGLGLSIARDIIIQHGGMIALDDSPFQGLRVRIRLPT